MVACCDLFRQRPKSGAYPLDANFTKPVHWSAAPDIIAEASRPCCAGLSEGDEPPCVTIRHEVDHLALAILALSPLAAGPESRGGLGDAEALAIAIITGLLAGMPLFLIFVLAPYAGWLPAMSIAQRAVQATIRGRIDRPRPQWGRL